jgi:hypothetical protein
VTAPRVTPSVTSARPRAAGWQRAPATVTLAADDDRDDGPAVEWRTAGGWQSYTSPFTVSEGV